MKYRFLLLLLSCLFVNDLASQNLITNGDFESGGSGVGFNINGAGYTLVSPPYPGTTVPGNYAFETNPQLVNTNFLAGTDHTSGTGKMMIFDGNTTAGIQYLYRLGTDDTGLCGLTIGASYTFSYWIKTISTEVTDINTRPSIKLLATGVEDFTFTEGSSLAPLPADGWQKRTYTFKAVDACVTIEMWNVNYSATGNDFALDDFSLHGLPGATATGTETACFNGASPNVTFTGSNGVAPYTFTYTINGGTPQTVVSNAAGVATISAPTSTQGAFEYEITKVSYGTAPAPVYENPVEDQMVTITVRDLTATFSGDITMCPGYYPVIDFVGSPGATVHFSADDGTPYTTVIEDSGLGSWSSPTKVNLTTSYTLDSISDGACTKPLTGLVTITINDVSGCRLNAINTTSPPNEAYVTAVKTTPLCEGFNTTTSLSAKYLTLRSTSDYTVTKLPTYNAFFAFTGGKKLIINGDDQWSGVHPLVFPFRFYNQAVTNTLVGSNGQLSFDLVAAQGGLVGGNELPNGTGTGANPPGGAGTQGCAWQFNGAMVNNPGGTGALNNGIYEKNAIFGVFQDIDPRRIIGGQQNIPDSNYGDINDLDPLVPCTQCINYYDYREAPNRVFIMNTKDIPMYNSIGGDLQSYQIVIYESTNYIDVNVERRVPTAWNGGKGLIGIINQNGSKALAAPGRNVTNWSNKVGTQIIPETWRFTPNGPILPVKLEWFEGNSATAFNTQIITDGSAPLDVEVTPSRKNTFYRVELTYTNPDLTTIKLYDYINVDRIDELPLLDPEDQKLCVNTVQTDYTFPSIEQDLHILNGENPLDFAITYHPTYNDAFYDATSLTSAELISYTVPAADLPKTIYVRITDMRSVGTGCSNVRSFVLNAEVAAGTFTYPNTAPFFCTSTATPVMPQTTNLTPGGRYFPDEPGLVVDPDTGALDLPNSEPGLYVVTYKIDSIDCPYSTTSGQIEVKPCCSVTSTPDFKECSGKQVTLDAFGTDPATVFSWTGPGLPANTVGNQITFTPPTTAGDYTYTVTGTVMGQPCDISGSTKVTVLELPFVNFSSPTDPTSPVCNAGTPTISFAGTPNAFVKYNYTVDATSGQNTVQLDAAGNYSFTSAAISNYASYEIIEVTSDTAPACVITTPPMEREFLVDIPTAAITTTGSPVTICANSGTSFTITGTAGATVNIELLNNTGTQTLPAVILDATGTYLYQTGNLTIDGNNTYTLTQVAKNCPGNITGSPFTVNVKALPTITSFTAAASFVCAGTSATFNVAGTANATINYNDGLSNKVLVLDGSGNGIITVPSTTLTSPIVVQLFDITTGGPSPACITTFAVPMQASVLIYDLPTITADPTDKVLCPADTSVSYSVTATGTNITYEWYMASSPTTPLADGPHYSGATTNTLTINNPTPADIGFYFARVTNPSCGFDDSTQAELGIDAPTVINTQPAGDTRCEGTPITTLTVAASGTPNLMYQWYFGTSATSLAALVNAGNISGANTPQLSIANITAANAGFYQCWISNNCPGETKSDIVQMQVIETPEVISQSADVTQCSSDATPVVLNIQTNGTAVTYKWYRNTVALSDSGNISGSSTDTLTINPAGVADSGDYTCEITSTDGCGTDTSSIIKVLIPEAPSIISGPVAVPAEPLPLSRCEGQFFSLHIDVPAGFTLQWQLDGINLVDGGRISGATTSTLNVTSVQLSDTGDYRCVVTGHAACTPLPSGIAHVDINAVPVITQQPQSDMICENSNKILSIGVQDPTGLTFQWQFNGVDLDGSIPNVSGYNTQELLITGATAANDGFYECIISSGCPDLPSQRARIIVIPLPTATITTLAPPLDTICSGNSSEVQFTGTPSAIVTYTVNGGAPQTITLNPSGTAILITGILTQTTTYALVQVERNDSHPCPAPLTGSATITVNPFPVVALDQEGYICLDLITNQTTSYPLETGLSDLDYDFEWYYNNTLLAETGPTLQADQGGIYKVVVTDVLTSCTGFATAPIEVSSPPVTITADATTTFFAENGTIVVTVTPAGDYEYRLDNGPYQSDNVFHNVGSLSNTTLGMHTVYARDLKACGELEFDVRIIDYPKYFTPNGDGYHDTWNISSLSEQSNAKIYIFDRFGKLVKQISTTGSGWDGTFNGKPLMADDYWFVIKYSEQGVNKEFKAHFSLKR